MLSKVLAVAVAAQSPSSILNVQKTLHLRGACFGERNIASRTDNQPKNDNEKHWPGTSESSDGKREHHTILDTAKRPNHPWPKLKLRFDDASGAKFWLKECENYLALLSLLDNKQLHYRL